MCFLIFWVGFIVLLGVLPLLIWLVFDPICTA